MINIVKMKFYLQEAYWLEQYSWALFKEIIRKIIFMSSNILWEWH